ncbi:MAG: phospho-N-acetylmuramoyl-pentapeptide-transferase [Phycisphaeraceae bacterium]|nr:phospho-N-acetylmuramoyl-pentapeptide-transferase [Phycisphaeraceae bacterium]
MLYNLINALEDNLAEFRIWSVLQVLNRVSFRALAAALAAFLIVVLLGRPVIRWLTARKIGDAAKFDHSALDRALESKQDTPTMGGVLIAGAILGATALFADLTNFYVQMALVLVVWMAMVGGVDDWLKLTASRRGDAQRQGLFAWEKLVFQLAIGAMLGWFVFRHGDSPPFLGHALNLPFQKTYDTATRLPADHLVFLPWWVFVPLSAVMIAGMSNAVNITDGMDGLASGITSFIAFALLVLCIIAGWQVASQYLLVPFVQFSDELSVLAGAMAGATLGFLWWNAAPASVFMGDTGSLCLGGLLGYIAIVIRQEILLLLMSGVFLLEIGSVVLQVGYFRMTGGKRIFRCAPFHWHLHLGGWPESRVVARLWIVTLILVAIALASIKVR